MDVDLAQDEHSDAASSWDEVDGTASMVSREELQNRSGADQLNSRFQASEELDCGTHEAVNTKHPVARQAILSCATFLLVWYVMEGLRASGFEDGLKKAQQLQEAFEEGLAEGRGWMLMIEDHRISGDALQEATADGLSEGIRRKSWEARMLGHHKQEMKQESKAFFAEESFDRGFNTGFRAGLEEGQRISALEESFRKASKEWQSSFVQGMVAGQQMVEKVAQKYKDNQEVRKSFERGLQEGQWQAEMAARDKIAKAQAAVKERSKRPQLSGELTDLCDAAMAFGRNLIEEFGPPMVALYLLDDVRTVSAQVSAWLMGR